jgi:hypothetical protein
MEINLEENKIIKEKKYKKKNSSVLELTLLTNNSGHEIEITS